MQAENNLLGSFEGTRRFPHPLRTALVFLGHWILSTIGIMVVTAFLTFTAVALIHIWRLDVGNKTASWLLTGTPYFPLQIAMAFLAGRWIMKMLGHVESLWVWILPACAMLVAMVHGPVVQLGGQASYSTISHFFGDGCRAQDGCFDQVAFTLPLYTGIAYSLGAVAGRIHAKSQNPLLQK
jgi:hypothetical protein